MGAARSLPGSGVMAAAQDGRGQSVAQAIPQGGAASVRPRGSPGNGPGAASARARDHRERSDRRFLARVGDVAPAESPGRARGDGRLRHGLFVAVLSSFVPVRQDQDRRLVRVEPALEFELRAGHPRDRRPWRRSWRAADRRGRGNRGPARVPASGGMPGSPGLSHRSAATDRGLCGGRGPIELAAPAASGRDLRLSAFDAAAAG